jgi:hypothetical protein
VAADFAAQGDRRLIHHLELFNDDIAEADFFVQLGVRVTFGSAEWAPSRSRPVTFALI